MSAPSRSAHEPMRPRGLLAGLRGRDPGLRATRRAGRAAIVVPLLLWLGTDPLGSPALATFAALGSIAMLVFVDFAGPMRVRVGAQAALAVTGAVCVCLGTLASQVTWLAVAATFAFAFAVLFAGVASSLLASSSIVLLISFVLPATLRAPSAAIPDRLLGWLLAGAVSMLAIRLLWPAPTSDPLRALSADACRRFARQLRAEVDCVTAPLDPVRLDVVQRLRDESAQATAALRDAFFATPYRPTGLSTSARASVRIIDRVIWLDRILGRAALGEPAAPAGAAGRALTTAVAELLDDSAQLLLGGVGDPRRLDDEIRALRGARDALEAEVTSAQSVDRARRLAPGTGADWMTSSLDPSFRAEEISAVVAGIATDVRRAVAAGRRGWRQRLAGQHDEHGSAWSSIGQRVGAHLTPHSVWLHSSLRGGAALALAVLAAELSDVQHAFWVVFGTLAVLRSSALSTGQDAIRAILGTVVGILVGGGLVMLVGGGDTVRWLILPPAVALAALGPVAFSFAVGQIGFTTALLVVNDIVDPAGWSVGLVRLEDVMIGCAVSVLVAALFWPRGAAPALARALADGLAAGAVYVSAAVDYGASRCESQARAHPRPDAERALTVAAGRRVDDAFRAFVSERGAKRLPLIDVAALVGAVAQLELTADGVIDLWERDERAVGGDRAAARRELACAAGPVVRWYEQTAAALAGTGPPPGEPPDDDDRGVRVVEAVRHDLTGRDEHSTATAVRLIWTADHVDAARRLRARISEPAARAVAARDAGGWLLRDRRVAA